MLSCIRRSRAALWHMAATLLKGFARRVERDGGLDQESRGERCRTCNVGELLAKKRSDLLGGGEALKVCKRHEEGAGEGAVLVG